MISAWIAWIALLIGLIIAIRRYMKGEAIEKKRRGKTNDNGNK